MKENSDILELFSDVISSKDLEELNKINSKSFQELNGCSKEYAQKLIQINPYYIKYIKYPTSDMVYNCLEFEDAKRTILSSIEHLPLDVMVNILIKRPYELDFIQNVPDFLLRYLLDKTKYSIKYLNNETFEDTLKYLRAFPYEINNFYQSEETLNKLYEIDPKLISYKNLNLLPVELFYKVIQNKKVIEFNDIPHYIRNKKTLIKLLNCVKITAYGVPKEWIDDNLAELLIKNNSYNILYIPKEKITNDMYKKALMSGDKELLTHIPLPPSGVIEEMDIHYYEDCDDLTFASQIIPNPTTDLQLQIVEERPECFKNIKNPSNRALELMINKHLEDLNYLTVGKDDELIGRAVKIYPNVINGVRGDTRYLRTELIRENPYLILSIGCTGEDILNAVDADPNVVHILDRVVCPIDWDSVAKILLKNTNNKEHFKDLDYEDVNVETVELICDKFPDLEEMLEMWL